MKLVFFDLDGTILHGVSSEKAFLWHLLKTGRLKGEQALAAFQYLLHWGWYFKRFIWVKNKAYLKGLPVNEVTKLAKIFVEKELIKRLRPKVIARVKDHLAAGDKVVLLTGAPFFLAKPLAEFLEIPTIFSTQFVIENGCFTKAPPSTHPFAENKLHIATDYCHHHLLPLNTAVAYGDSRHDLLLLNAVGTPVAVTPDKKLRKVAKTKGWEILEI